jgi:hypothetical protein
MGEIRAATWMRPETALPNLDDAGEDMIEAGLFDLIAAFRDLLERHHRWTDSPVAIITKSTLIRRDLDVLSRLAQGPGAQVTISIPFLDEDAARSLEPGAPTPSRRRTMGSPTRVTVRSRSRP